MRRATAVVTLRARALTVIAIGAIVGSVAACQMVTGSDPIRPSMDDATIATPPSAALAAEGEVPVVGQLGSFTWGGSGSDAGWLPGTPIAVGAGKTLTVHLVPAVVVVDWTSRTVPAGRIDATGARSLGNGSGMPQFGAPGPGRWTVEVRVTAAGGVDSASYFWLLEIP